jgi:hypothetical protein
MCIRRFGLFRRGFAAALILPLLLWCTDVTVYAKNSTQDKVKGTLKSVELKSRFIIISYELSEAESESYEVGFALLKEGDTSFKVQVQSATGDIGIGKFSGGIRQVRWEFARDYPPGLWELTRDSQQGLAGGYYIEMTVKKVGGSNLLYYVAGGLVFLGGVAALLLSGTKSVGSAELPAAPARPAQ